MSSIFIVWMIIVFIFSSQNGSQSGKVSEKVTKKLLQTKDTLEIVAENYQETNEIVIKGIEIDPITKARIDKWEVPVRKLAHYILFFTGGFVIYILIIYVFSITTNKWVISIFFGMLLACMDEFHQMYSANRTPRLFDVGIDTLGVITGIIISSITVKIIDKLYIKWRGKNEKFQTNSSTKNIK